MDPTGTYVGFGVVLAITWLTVAARVYVRHFIVKTFDLGDWLIVTTNCFLTAFVCIIWYMVSIGMGQHEELVSEENRIMNVEMFYVNELLYIVATMTLKLSIALLLLRFTAARGPRWTILITIVGYMVYGFITIIILIFQCTPIQLTWNKALEGRCLSRLTLVCFVYLHAVTSLITDGVFSILPIWLIWNIQLSKRTKISLSLVLGLGLTTAIVNVARFFYISPLISPIDITYKFYPIGLTSLLELAIGVVAASAVTLRPLMRVIYRSLGYKSTSASDRVGGTGSKGRLPSWGAARSAKPSVGDVEIQRISTDSWGRPLFAVRDGQ